MVRGRHPDITVLVRGNKGQGWFKEFFSKLQRWKVAEGDSGTRKDPCKSADVCS